MKPNQPEVFDRLDQAYACWEEHMWKNRLRRKLSELNEPNYKARINEIGFPVDNAHKTKQLLLEAVSRGSADYLLPDIRKKGYVSKPEVNLQELKRVEKIPNALEKSDAYTDDMRVSAQWDEFHFPYYLGKWNVFSRRVYFLTDDLVLQLRTTSLKGLTLRDIKLPFPSFSIALESPIVDEKMRELDFFLIGDFSRENWAMYALARSLSKWKRINPILRSKIDEAARKRNLRRFMQFANGNSWVGDVMSHWDAMTESPGFSDKDMEEDLERELSNYESTDKGDWMTDFFRIFVGLCFYLQTFTKTYSGLVEQVPPVKKIYAGTEDGPALMSAADVCKVQSVVKLTLEEKTIIRDQLSGRGGWEVRAHFREGFWRRRPGEGQNPAAKKIVWVRPTLVRRDRLPKNALPLGVGKVIVV